MEIWGADTDLSSILWNWNTPEILEGKRCLTDVFVLYLRYISAVGQHMPSTAAGAVDWAYLNTGPLIVSKLEFANSGLKFVPSLIV